MLARLLLAILVTLSAAGALSCARSPSVNVPVVQVWESDSMVASYALPIELRITDGAHPAEARWVSIRWGGDEKSGVMLYGSQEFEPEGAFEIAGDVGNLQTAIR